jgi:hypothetical protein
VFRELPAVRRQPFRVFAHWQTCSRFIPSFIRFSNHVPTPFQRFQYICRIRRQIPQPALRSFRSPSMASRVVEKATMYSSGDLSMSWVPYPLSPQRLPGTPGPRSHGRGRSGFPMIPRTGSRENKERTPSHVRRFSVQPRPVSCRGFARTQPYRQSLFPPARTADSSGLPREVKNADAGRGRAYSRLQRPAEKIRVHMHPAA